MPIGVTSVAAAVEKVAGRRFLWRLGRSLYLEARRERGNEICSNGEQIIQQAVVEAAKSVGKVPVVFDVGANRGQWAEALISTAVDLGAPLDLTSFEPVPQIYRLLRSAFERHAGRPGMSLKTKCLALSDNEGTAQFCVTEGSSTHHLKANGGFDDYEELITVQTHTVDQVLRDEKICHLDLLKIDCEGFDPLVIKGAQKSLEASKIGAIQFEYNHRWIQSRHYLFDIFKVIEGLPYRLGKVTPQGIEVYAEWSAELERFFEANYVLVHLDRLQSFPHRSLCQDDSNVFA